MVGVVGGGGVCVLEGEEEGSRDRLGFGQRAGIDSLWAVVFGHVFSSLHTNHKRAFIVLRAVGFV